MAHTVLPALFAFCLFTLFLFSFYNAGRAVMAALPATALTGGRELLGVNLAQQAVSVAPTVHHVEHVTDVYADTTGQALVKPDVAGE